MTKRSMLNESRQIERAVKLISLGARLQVLEGETELSYERLLKLYKEVAGKSPPQRAIAFFYRLVFDMAAQHSCIPVHEYLQLLAKNQPFRRCRVAHQGL